MTTRYSGERVRQIIQTSFNVMRRAYHLLSRFNCLVILIVLRQQFAYHAEAAANQQDLRDLNSAIRVDTKYWIRNTEFGEKANWLDGLMPCTLLERIRIHEKSVVSMGPEFGTIGSSIESYVKELSLAMDGVLLLEDDNSNPPKASLGFNFLNPNCSDTSAGLTDGRKQLVGDEDGAMSRLFQFEPDSDQMSWFNPENWLSQYETPELGNWIPDSHRIPCSEDIVVFGLPNLEMRESSKLTSFKVNFRANSQVSDKLKAANVSINNIRVSKLRIGDQWFTQKEFERLVRSDTYENILFEFNSSEGMLKPEEGFAYPSHSLLMIDESSIRPYSSEDWCLDEAGCLCGNENMNVMKIICSFYQPLDDSDQPCRDPQVSAGYCNKVCASILTISMDPNRFKESFIKNALIEVLTSESIPVSDEHRIFIGPRRISETKYEITFRPAPRTRDEYEKIKGKEDKLALLVYDKINRASIRSFYGIKSISIKSSKDWLSINSQSIFWLSFIGFVSAILMIHYLTKHYRMTIVLSLRGWLGDTRTTTLWDGSSRYTEPNSEYGIDETSNSEIPLVKMTET